MVLGWLEESLIFSDSPPFTDPPLELQRAISTGLELF